MPKETIELSEEDAAFIREAIARCDYANADEVVSRGLQSLRDYETRKKQAEEKLRKMLDDARASGTVEFDPREAWAEVEARYRQRKSQT